MPRAHSSYFTTEFLLTKHDELTNIVVQESKQTLIFSSSFCVPHRQ